MEEPPFLMPVQRIVGGVEVENDLRWGAAVRVQEQVNKHRLNGGTVMADAVILRRLGPAQLQPVRGALAGQGGAVRPACREFARQHRQHRVVSQFIVVGQVL